MWQRRCHPLACRTLVYTIKFFNCTQFIFSLFSFPIVIRRKSASERLAESKSKYIRSDLESNETFRPSIIKRDCYQPFASHLADEETIDGSQPVTNCTMRLLRATPTSTKSSHTSSCRLSPISDHQWVTTLEDKGTNNVHSPGNLVDRIHCELNKSKQYSTPSCSKKRVSPKNSDGSQSNGKSNLEIKLRELITLDNGNESIGSLNDDNYTSPQPKHCLPAPNIVTSQMQQSQQQNESENIYFAELKFITTSSSSLSSMYFEPNHESLSSPPIQNDNGFQNHLSDKLVVAPSIRLETNQTANVIRSKSDVSPKKPQVIERYRNSHTAHIERLFGSLGLDSDSYHQENKHIAAVDSNRKSSIQTNNNLRNYSFSSPSNDSLDKEDKHSVDVGTRKLVHKHMNLSGHKSSSINELSSLESSQLSVSDHIYKSALNQSKSTSKLTFENLMLHQQNLASSRSCHNLVASLQSGPSVVERNARIIKWLFNCRKAMSQTQPCI